MVSFPQGLEGGPVSNRPDTPCIIVGKSFWLPPILQPSARKLNSIYASTKEQQIYRIDHFWVRNGVQNIRLPFATQRKNRYGTVIIEAESGVWRLQPENLGGIEDGRDSAEGAGALRDMAQKPYSFRGGAHCIGTRPPFSVRR